MTMPDLPHSTKHPQHSSLRTLPQTLAQACTGGGGGILFNFAHVLRIFSRPLDYVTPKIKSDEALGDLAARAISLRVSLRQTAHAQGERNVLRKNGIDASSTKDA
jgi:hypothetical protein